MPPSRIADAVVAEVPQQPPQPRGAALAGLVVGDDGRAVVDAGAARGGLEVARAPAAGDGRARRAASRGRSRRRGTPRRGSAPCATRRSPAPGSPSFQRQSTTTRSGFAQPRPQLVDRDQKDPFAWQSACYARDGARGIRGRRCGRPTLPDPEPGPGQVLLDVHACAVCRTDLHVVDGELYRPEAAARARPPDRRDGDRRRAGGGAVRRPATASACRGSAGPTATAAVPRRAARTCASTRASPATRSTAATPSGPSPTSASASRCRTPTTTCSAAPLLCAGLIGYRALRMTGDAERVGLYGFGASAHIVAQLLRHQGRRVFAFTRAEDDAGAVVRARARRRVGGRLDGPGARAARRRDHLRAGRRRSCPRRCARPARPASSSARAST